MSFIDELNSMPPPEKPKSLEEQQFEWFLKEAHQAIKKACIEERAQHFLKRYLFRGHDYDSGSFCACSPSLYATDYPYKKKTIYNKFLRRSTTYQVQLCCFNGLDYYVISEDLSECKKHIERLSLELRKDGFSLIRLTPVIVYKAIVKKYPTLSDDYEEGKLTNIPAGYVIQLELKW